MSAPKNKLCVGCTTWFTFDGYNSHLKQTKRPACVAVREAARAGNDSDDSDGSSSAGHPSSRPASDHPDQPHLDAPLDAISFGGDLYGDYAAEDFDDYDEYDDHDLEDRSEGEERWLEDLQNEEEEDIDTQNFEAEGDWEAPLCA